MGCPLSVALELFPRGRQLFANDCCILLNARARLDALVLVERTQAILAAERGLYLAKNRVQLSERVSSLARVPQPSATFVSKLLNLHDELSRFAPVEPKRPPDDCEVELVAERIALVCRVQNDAHPDVFLDRDLDAFVLLLKRSQEQRVVAAPDHLFRRAFRELRRCQDLRDDDAADADRVRIQIALKGRRGGRLRRLAVCVGRPSRRERLRGVVRHAGTLSPKQNL